MDNYLDKQGIYHELAGLFRYPDETLLNDIEKSLSLLKSNYPSAFENLQLFYDFVKEISLTGWQEIYTRTFDVQAITTLELGYVLFGEDYKRGELLVNLSNEHKKAANDCGLELADYLPNVLRLLKKLSDTDLINDLISYIIKPALVKMIAEFDDDKIDQKNKVYEKHHRTLIRQENNNGRMYQKLLLVISNVIYKDFPDDSQGVSINKSFTKEITTELEIQS